MITQGLTGYTLVDKKKILFRLFVNPSDFCQVASVAVTITYRIPIINFTFKINLLIPRDRLLVENELPNGPSIGILFEGKIFPSAYVINTIEFRLMSASGVVITIKTPDIKFSQSGRLRILIKTIQSITRTAPWGNKIQSDIFWLVDLFDAMKRFGAILPVSDGVRFGSNPDPNEGLGFIVGENIDAWPAVCPNGSAPSVPDTQYPNFLVCPAGEMMEFMLKEAKDLKSMGVRVDITVAWRLRDLTKPPSGEPAGGQASNGTNPPPDRRFASIVGGLQNGFQTTGALLAHEVAHNFGCVLRESPHSDGGGHSKDLDILDPYAFDFVLLRPYIKTPRGPLADVMGQHWGRGNDLTLYSAYDWEHLRKRLSQLSAAITITGKETENIKENLIVDLKLAFNGLHQIDTENPQRTLPSKTGSAWHWTPNGLKLLKNGEKKTNNGDLSSEVETIFSTLKANGINEVYVPISEKPLTVIVNPDINYINCEIGDSITQD